ncbi:21501_t:CDS:2, partial [Gigaspora margarita]
KIQNKLIQESLSKEITKESIINLQQSSIVIPIEDTKDIQETSNQKENRSVREAKIRTSEIVASTSYLQPGKIEKKEIKPKQIKLNSTRNLDQSNTALIDSTIKNHKDGNLDICEQNKMTTKCETKDFFENYFSKEGPDRHIFFEDWNYWYKPKLQIKSEWFNSLDSPIEDKE